MCVRIQVDLSDDKLEAAAGGRHGRRRVGPPLHEVSRGGHGDGEATVSALMAQESNQTRNIIYLFIDLTHAEINKSE